MEGQIMSYGYLEVGEGRGTRQKDVRPSGLFRSPIGSGCSGQSPPGLEAREASRNLMAASNLECQAEELALQAVWNGE